MPIKAEVYAQALMPGWKQGYGSNPNERDLALSIAAYRVVDAIATAASTLTGKVRDWRDRRVAVRALWALDDRLLRDIGIERYEIHEVVDKMLASRACTPARTAISASTGDARLAA